MTELAKLGIERWYPLVRGTARVAETVALREVSDLAARAERLATGEVLAIVERGQRRGTASRMSALLRRTPPGFLVERLLILPGTGGAVTLVPCHPRAHFESGLRLFPAGRRLTRLAQSALGGPGGRSLALHFGWGEVALVRRASDPEQRDALAPAGYGFAVSEGVPGPHVKFTLMLIDPKGQPSAYLKVAGTPQASGRLRAEAEALRTLAAGARRSAPLGPRLLAQSHPAEQPAWLAQTPLPGSRGPDQVGPPHLAFVAGLAQRAGGHRPFDELRALALAAADRNVPLDERDAPLADALVQLQRALGSSLLPWAPSHGDLTPWNTRLEGGTLRAFDWELAEPSAPALFDLFHYHLQVGVLVRRADAGVLLREALGLARGHAGGPAAPHAQVADAESLLAAYVLLAAGRDLAAHRMQRPPFPQVDWLGEARRGWAAELTRILAERHAIQEACA